jgi:hypothetical protein
MPAKSGREASLGRATLVRCDAGDAGLSDYQLPFWAWPTAMITVWGLAQWRGRDEERLAAGSALAAWAVGMVVARARSDNNPQDTEWGILPIDITVLGVLLWIVLRTRRRWPVVAAALQLLAVATYFVRPAYPIVGGWTYVTVQLLWSYLLLVAIGYGAWTAPRDVKRAAP